MIKLVDSNGAKKLDENAQKMGMSGMVLMERAALAVAEFIRTRLAENNQHKKIISICGSGNNGGDGIACARILYEWGYDVEILVIGKEEKFTKQTSEQVDLALNSGVRLEIVSPSELINENKSFDNTIIIDAIFGVGFKGKLEGELEKLVDVLNMSDSIKVAVDIPSGVNGSNGTVLGTAVKCGYTITFGMDKIGLAVYPGKEYAGETVIADIGFPGRAVEMTDYKAFSFDKKDIGHYLLKRKEYSNKGDFGNILIIAGSEDMCGASYLSALAAYRTGAGLVRIFTPDTNRTSLQSLIPEAVLTTYTDESDADISDETMEKLKKAVREWADVIVIGPGLGISRRSKSLVKKALDIAEVSTVIDADGLRLFREINEEFYERKLDLAKDMKKNFILTPHVKELSDLLYVSKEEVKENIIQFAENLRSCCGVIVMKEAKTVAAGADNCYINNSGNSGMAKAGSGDVLTGIIAALLVNENITQFETVSLGVFIHGLAGDLLVEEKGKHGILARELADETAEVMKRYV